MERLFTLKNYLTFNSFEPVKVKGDRILKERYIGKRFCISGDIKYKQDEKLYVSIPQYAQYSSTKDTPVHLVLHGAIEYYSSPHEDYHFTLERVGLYPLTFVPFLFILSFKKRVPTSPVRTSPVFK